MYLRRIRTTELVVVAAAIEMFLGLAIYVVPREFGAPVYAPLRPFFPTVSAALVAGGVTLLLLIRYPLRFWLRRALWLLPVIPLVVLAHLFAHAAAWTGAILYGLLAVALLVAPWISASEAGKESGAEPDLSLVVLALLEGSIGALMLLVPDSFASQNYIPLRGLLTLAGSAGLTGAAALLLPTDRSPWTAVPQPVRRMAGAVLPLLLVYNFMRIAYWTGVLAWGTWAVALLAGRSIRERLSAEWTGPAPGGEQDDPLPLIERKLEGWAWLLAVMVEALTALGGAGSVASPVRANLFVLSVAAYNTVVHWGLPRLGTPARRITWHLTFLTVALGIILAGAGPVGMGFLVLLTAIPPLASRALGPEAGRRMLALTLVTVIVGKLDHLLMGSEPANLVLGEAAVEMTALTVAAVLGIRSAGEQRQMIRELSGARAELRRQVDTLSIVDKISTAVRASLVLDEILRTTANELGRVVGVSHCRIRLVQNGEFVSAGYEYLAPGVAAMRMDAQHAIWPIALQNRQVVIVTDVAADPRLDDPAYLGRRDELLDDGIRAMLISPILADEELVGVIAFHQCDAPREWTQEEVQLLEAISGQTSVAILHARMHQVLVEHHTALAEAHQDQQSANEELLAQQEELEAQNEELRSQNETILVQRDQLEETLEAAHKLEKERARLVAILDATPDLVVIADPHGRLLYMNSAGGTMLGLGRDEAISGMHIADCHLEQVTSGILAEGFAAAVDDGVWVGETVLRSRDGREIPGLQVLLAHKGVDGTVEFLSTTVRDITERKQAEEVLRESEERFRTAFANAPIGMALVQTDGRALQVNRSLCEMLGYTEQELLTMTSRELTHPDDWTPSLEYMRQMLAGEIHTIQREKRYRHKHGHVISVQLSTSLVRDRHGSPLYIISQIQDITERKRFEAHLRELAAHDPLTGLLNRRRFQEELEQQLAHADRHGTSVALLFLDLDQFKYVNDSLGHQAGDDLLKSIAILLQKRLRRTDVIARLGGDEFAILLFAVNALQARPVAEQIVSALREHITLAGGRSLSITASIGIAIFPEHGTTAEELLAKADVALYKAKDHGRDGVWVFAVDQERDLQIESKLVWEQQIREALKKDRFVLYGQPILNLRTNQITAYELLLRMVGDDGQLVAPRLFLDVAERSGLIHALDRWVMRQAIRFLAANQHGGRDFDLSANISAKAFSDQDLLAIIQGELRATGVNPNRLMLEITETAAITDINQAVSFMGALQQMGCRFALDDFGAGFSSFYYLRHLPLNYVKIDGNLIKDLPQSTADQHMVRGLVELAHGLGAKTIAEFVEDEETVQLLREYGVDYAQGYHIGRPRPWA